MTNEEIKNKWYKEEPTFDELLNLARQDEREKMQGVEVFISWDSEDDEFEPQEKPCSVWADRPEYDREFGTFVGNLGFECEAAAWLFNIPESFCDMLGVDSGQCKKFRIVEVLP